jgi:activating signal cointegrator complex subunit 3
MPPLLLPAAAGLGIHHAGMLRSDRSLMERAFGQGLIKASCP